VVRKYLLVLSLLGMGLMGGIFTLSYVAPLELERMAREAVRIEVERQVGEAVDRLSDSKVAALARRELRKTESEIERTENAIRQQIPRKVALVVADMLQADCECRKRLIASVESVAKRRLASLQSVQDNLADYRLRPRLWPTAAAL
jgi:Mg2+ and Co2+ transporter CorA